MFNWQAHAVSLLVVQFYAIGAFLIGSLQMHFPICFPPVHHEFLLTTVFQAIGVGVRRACEQLPHVQQSAVIVMYIKMSNLFHLDLQAVLKQQMDELVTNNQLFTCQVNQIC